MSAALVLAACQDGNVVAPAATNAPSTSVPGVKGNPAAQPKQQLHLPAGVQAASLVTQAVPASVIVSYNGLEWVWASPCALNGCTSGILIGKDGFGFATMAQWALRPPVSAFAGKCASPWFDTRWDHCDWSDPLYGYYGSAPSGQGGPVANGIMYSFSETWLVRVPTPVDATPPVITPTVTGTLGSNGWYTSDINVSWSVTDAESSISSQTGCTTSNVTSDVAAVTFTCSATSLGGTDSKSVTVKRDATVPTVAYAGNAGSYTVADNVAIGCSSSDNLSGVASSTCANVAGAAYTFSLGSNSFSADATDQAGNVGHGTTSFSVTVTQASLCTLTSSFVNKAGVANALCAKLNASAAAAARGDTNASQNQLGAYINDVQAQTGKSVTADNAAVLIRLANALM